MLFLLTKTFEHWKEVGKTGCQAIGHLKGTLQVSERVSLLLRFGRLSVNVCEEISPELFV